MTNIFSICPPTRDDYIEIQSSIIEWSKSLDHKDIGKKMFTAGGFEFTYGPNAESVAEDWLHFLLDINGKHNGVIIHYGDRTEFSSSYMTDRVVRHSICPPLDEASSIWIQKRLTSRSNEDLFMMSSTLLADWLIKSKSYGWTLDRDIILVSDEFLPNCRDMLHGCQTRTFLRCWKTGFTYWQCAYGNTHVPPAAIVVETDDDGRFQCIDGLNQSATEHKQETGDFGTISKDIVMCPCGRWYRPLLHCSSHWSLVVDKFGHVVNLFPSIDSVPLGWQVLQRFSGQVMVLKSEDWTQNDMENIRHKLSDFHIDLVFARGWFRKHCKKPHCCSLLFTNKNHVAWYADKEFTLRRYAKI